ncbi:MAG: M23 family metallopeptidase [Myxococcota bacterium]
MASLLARVLSLASLALGLACAEAPEVEPPPPPYVPERSPVELGPKPDFVGPVASTTIKHNDSLSVALARVGVNAAETDHIVRALLGEFDFRHARPGHELSVLRGPRGELVWFQYTAGPRSLYHVSRDSQGELHGMGEAVTVLRQTVFVEGSIQSSLYDAMSAAGEGAALTMLLVDLFAWDIDFYTETQKGDRFRLIFEKELVDGRFVSYGKILGAEYLSASGRRTRAFHYVAEDGVEGYYTGDGTSVRKAFLKSPIQFTSITSGFGFRHHPIINTYGEHKGIDYGAPAGTSIWSVADGVVTHAGPAGGYGNMVAVRHANGYETRYAHMRAFASGIHVGKRVEQKAVLGYVGQTGLATGPHLHFEVLVHGQHTNPLKISVPPAPPIKSEEMPAFRAAIAFVMRGLEDGVPAVALGSASPAAGSPN